MSKEQNQPKGRMTVKGFERLAQTQAASQIKGQQAVAAVLNQQGSRIFVPTGKLVLPEGMKQRAPRKPLIPQPRPNKRGK